ncbi:MAG: PKD domain-containing protein [Planctomycetota bacterium]
MADPVEDTLEIDGMPIVTRAKAPEGHPFDEVYSGWLFREAETRDAERDSIENPGMIAVEDGEVLWNKVEGTAGKSCASCHGDPVTGVVTGNRFGNSFAPSCYQCHDGLWTHDNTAPDAPTMADLSGTVGKAVTFDASHIDDADGDPLALEWNFGDGSLPGFPSHNPKSTHTYNDYGVFTATLAVTDGVAEPQYVQFTVTIEPATIELADTWTVDVASVPPETFSITFESHSGSLVGVKDGSSLAFGIEFVGVIFWMEMWMDLSGNVFWGTGDMYFGNIDRERGTMEGVVFDDTGGVVTFSGTKP